MGAHRADLKTQAQYGVKYLRYWVDEKNGKVFCLAEAPAADAVVAVHREAHVRLADKIYEVVEGTDQPFPESGYISPAEMLRMLPSGSVNQTAFTSPIVATPLFHSNPSISKVMNSTPFARSSSTSLSKSDTGTSKDTAVPLFVPAYADS